MKRTWVFLKRNLLEMIRDPLIYIFALAFPILMVLLFFLINHFTGGSTMQFEARNLLPGMVMFSYLFVMLLLSLLVSKDRMTSFLRRLYVSPMKNVEFLSGYLILGLLIGILQSILLLFVGFLLSVFTKETYFSFLSSVLLVVSQLPLLLFSLSMGIFIGSSLNDKAAPGITSVFITLGGMLGGCYMPVDMMGDFEIFCRVLPFYPSVYIGRIVVGANHSDGSPYAFDNVAGYGLLTIFLYLGLSLLLACFFFYRQRKRN